MQRLVKIFLLLSTLILLVGSPAWALTDEMHQIYRIGVIKFNNYSNFPNASEFAADGFAMWFPQKANIKAGVIKADIGLLNKENLIDLAKREKIDAILTGNIREYTVKRDIWLGGEYAKVTIEATLYSGKTGEILWQGKETQRGRGNSDIHDLQSAGRRSIEAIIKGMMEAGLQGRTQDLEKPTLTLPGSNFNPTSVYFLEGKAQDNCGVTKILINNNKTTLDDQGNFKYPIKLEQAKVEVLVRVEDETGNFTEQTINVVRVGQVKGQVAQVAGEKVYLNIGYQNGVKKGMGFTVVTTDVIKDPSSGKILDKLQRPLGIIQVIECKPNVSIAEILDSSILGEIKPGDTVN